MNQGKIIIIAGPSGVGKGVIIKGILDSKEIDVNIIKSYTTRPKNPRDKKIKNHMHISKDKFLDMTKENKFAETNYYNGNYYGTLKSDIENVIKSNKIGLIEQNLDKAIKTKKNYKNVTIFFIYASLETIRQRLKRRGENTPDEIKKRLEIAKKELSEKDNADYSILNPENFPEKAIRKIIHIIKSTI